MLPLRATLLLPTFALLASCMVAVSEVEITHHNDREDSYLVKRNGDRITKIEVDWDEEKILEARAIVFCDLNKNRLPDDGEILHDVPAELERPRTKVVWRSLRLDEGEHKGPFRVQVLLKGEERGAYERVVQVMPEGLLDW